jgi:hypothetical protein
MNDSGHLQLVGGACQGRRTGKIDLFRTHWPRSIGEGRLPSSFQLSSNDSAMTNSAGQRKKTASC